MLDLGVYDFEDFSFGSDGFCCDLGCFCAETISCFAVCEACCVDAYVELCSEDCAAGCERAYACVRY
jgi:hypothetical protein